MRRGGRNLAATDRVSDEEPLHPNGLSERLAKNHGFWSYLLEAFKEPTKLISIVCAIITTVMSIVVEDTVLHEWPEIAGIVATIIIGVFSGVANFITKMPVDRKTPLQARTYILAASFGIVGCAILTLDVVQTVIRISADDSYKEKKEINNASMRDPIDLPSFARCVMAIFQGLSLGVNCVLAFALRRMTRRHRLQVKDASVCESLRLATVIMCLDNIQGVFTTNTMAVGVVRTGLGVLDSISVKDPGLRDLFKQAIGLGIREGSNNPTEEALLSWAVSILGMNTLEIRGNHGDVHDYIRHTTYSQIHSLSNDGTMQIHIYGSSAKEVLASCSTYYEKNGHIEHISEDVREQLERMINAMVSSNIEYIAFAHMEIPGHDVHEDSYEDIMNYDGYTFMGFVGVMYPCIEGVKEIINNFKNAGVKVKLITEENLVTAKGIARECGILKDSSNINRKVIEGEEFSRYPNEEKMGLVEDIQVMWGSSSYNKIEVVDLLQKRGEKVVAISEDESVLRKVDIGVYVETESKDARAIVVISRGWTWGQTIHNNIRRFIQFQVLANVVAFVINFVCVSHSGVYLVTTSQLVWVNIVMVVQGVVALACEPAPKVLTHVSRSSPLITNMMWRNIAVQSLYQVVALLIIHFVGKSMVADRVNNAIVFNTFLLLQLFNLLSSRRIKKVNVRKGLHKHYAFGVIVVLSIALFLVMQVFTIIRFEGTERLNWKEWGVCLGTAIVSLVADMIAKCIPVPETPSLLSYILGKMINGHSIRNARDSNHFVSRELVGVRVETPTVATRNF